MDPRHSHNILILFELSLDFRFQHSRSCTTHSFNYNDQISLIRIPVLRCASSPCRSLRSAHEPRHVSQDTLPRSFVFHYSILRHIARYVPTLLCSRTMIPTLDVPFSHIGMDELHI